MRSLKNNHLELLDFDAPDFSTYLNGIIHDWLKVLAVLAIILVPLFFVLDFFIVPNQLLTRVGIYRMISVALLVVQYVIIRYSSPKASSYYHGYFVSINVGAIIALMTVDLGGFNAPYYAGLNLVIIGVNLLLPWRAIHSSVNCLIIIVMYILFNLLANQPYDPRILTNNLFFLLATAVVAVSINHVKYKLVYKEFSLLIQLRQARDSLWGEMELAKRIQTALLPTKEGISGYEIAAAMFPAKEVGGDYYDIIETENRSRWVSMGDVSGHGVDSGLIMMMAQTSIISMVNSCGDCPPSDILEAVNTALRENINRLGSEHYMTLMLIRLEDSSLQVAGQHQDLIVYRAAQNKTEVIPVDGTWIGIIGSVKEHMPDHRLKIHSGDIILLFSDGITEAFNEKDEMFGQERLEQLLNHYADLPVSKIVSKIVEEVQRYQVEQLDDMTIVVLRKIPQPTG